MLKLKYCYHKCIKKFFGYNKFHSVTEMLLDLGLPSFDTVITDILFLLCGVTIIML